MARRLSAVVLAAALCGCQATSQRAVRTLPLRDEGAVHVYLQPALGDAPERILLTLSDAAAIAQDGTRVPLTAADPGAGGAGPAAQQLLAQGELPPGAYTGIELRIARARLLKAGRPSDLLAPSEPVQLALPFTIGAGRATVLWALLQREQAVVDDMSFDPRLRLVEPSRPSAAFAGFASHPGADQVTLFDRASLSVAALLSTGRAPHGLALDVARGRLFVAQSDDDEIRVLEPVTGVELGRVRLDARDAPRELALTPDGRTLLALCPLSRSVAFVDPETLAVTGRVEVGDEPLGLRLDRRGARAYVLRQQPSALVAIDVPGQALLGAVAVDPEPVDFDLNRAGNRIYVSHRTTPFLTVLGADTLGLARRVNLRANAGALRVDPRTDLLWVAHAAEGRLEVWDPFSLTAIEALPVPGRVGALAIDDAENALHLLLPEERRVVVLDLTSRRLRGALELPAEPWDLLLAGER